MEKLQEIVNKSRSSQNKKELFSLLSVVSEANPKTIIEIGSWRGYLLETLDSAFNKVSEPIFLLGVEKDASSVAPEMADKFKIIIEDSQQTNTLLYLKKLLGNKKIDLLLIDGDHRYSAVKQDFESFSPLVRKGGFVAFHDIKLTGKKWRDSGVEVSKLWLEIRNTGQRYYEFYDQDGQGTGTGLLQL